MEPAVGLPVELVPLTLNFCSFMPNLGVLKARSVLSPSSLFPFTVSATVPRAELPAPATSASCSTG